MAKTLLERPKQEACQPMAGLLSDLSTVKFLDKTCLAFAQPQFINQTRGRCPLLHHADCLAVGDVVRQLLIFQRILAGSQRLLTRLQTANTLVHADGPGGQPQNTLLMELDLRFERYELALHIAQSPG